MLIVRARGERVAGIRDGVGGCVESPDDADGADDGDSWFGFCSYGCIGGD